MFFINDAVAVNRLHWWHPHHTPLAEICICLITDWKSCHVRINLGCTECFCQAEDTGPSSSLCDEYKQ